MEKLIDDIVKSLEKFKDDKRVKFAYANHPTKMRIIGVTNPNQKIVLKELISVIVNWGPQERLGLIKKLSNSNIFECQHIALEYFSKDKKIWEIITAKDIVELNTNMDNWVSVDSYSVYLCGKAWRLGILNDKFIKDFLNSSDFWQRRIAVVSTVALNLKSQGGTGDIKRTLDICKFVVEDYQMMIVKALSWALRELAKRYKEPVIEFIDKYEEILHKKVLAEVRNKVYFGRKRID